MKLKPISVFVSLLVTIGLLWTVSCSKGPKYPVKGKWQASIKYQNGKVIGAQWIFNEDGTFHEFGGEPWGTYTVEGDKIKIERTNKKEYYTGTLDKKNHMAGSLVYVGFEDKGPSITWEAVKTDE